MTWEAPTGKIFVPQDAVDLLRSLPDACVNLLVTDPPYNSLEKHRKRGTTTRLSQSGGSSNKWFDVVPPEYFVPFFAEVYRVLAPDSHAYVMCDGDMLRILPDMGEAAGFKFWKALIWDKEAMGMGYHYRAQHEFILFFEKGKRSLNSLAISDVLRFKRIKSKHAYPTEKPVPLLQVLIEQSTEAGEFVLDPFCGSGSTIEAAIRSGRHFLACDKSDDAVALSTARVIRTLDHLASAPPKQKPDVCQYSILDLAVP